MKGRYLNVVLVHQGSPHFQSQLGEAKRPQEGIQNRAGTLPSVQHCMMHKYRGTSHDWLLEMTKEERCINS